jgi:carbonic anhydrase
MSATDELLSNAAAHAERFGDGDAPARPAKKVAVIACMDARLNPYEILGLELGDAHVIRNAGGVVTDDEIRSLAISQRLLGTEEVVLIHHTECGLLTLSDEDLRRELCEETGVEPPWHSGAFSDLEQDVRDSIERIVSSPFIPNKDSIRGFVYDVKTGTLDEVKP